MSDLLTEPQVWRAARLWCLGADTAEIAETLKVSEAAVWNAFEAVQAASADLEEFPLRASATTQQET